MEIKYCSKVQTPGDKINLTRKNVYGQKPHEVPKKL